MIFDANGDTIDYIAIGVGAQAMPGCFGAKTTLMATAGGGDTGDAMRAADGTGAWPAPVPKISYNTIGRSNACTSGGGDLVINVDADLLKPVVNSTTVTCTVRAFNKACSPDVSGVHVLVTNLDG